MNFPESVAYLYGLGNEVLTMKLGLDNIRALLEALGNPQKKYSRIQIAGTNGKGSVCAFLESILLEGGIKCGVMTSPHLVSITERIRIGGKDIDEADFARHATMVREAGERLAAESAGAHTVPTFFEQVTAIAALAFAEAGVEWAVLETGLGGRLDATTALDSEIAVITRVDLDHQEFLGDTVEEIAAEKAAVIRGGMRAVIGAQEPDAMSVIIGRCKSVGVEPIVVSDFAVGSSASADAFAGDSLSINTGAHSYDVASIGLVGRHQTENAVTAILAAEIVGIDEASISTGIANARHRGRLELVGDVLLDGAHNESGAAALAEFLSRFEARPVTIIFGAMREKDVSKIARILFPRAANLIAVKAENARSLSAHDIAAEARTVLEGGRVFEAESMRDALEQARRLKGADGLICVTGSLYLVGEARKILTAS